MKKTQTWNVNCAASSKKTTLYQSKYWKPMKKSKKSEDMSRRSRPN